MHTNKTSLIMLSIVLTVSLLLAACGGTKPTEPPPAEQTAPPEGARSNCAS